MSFILWNRSLLSSNNLVLYMMAQHCLKLLYPRSWACRVCSTRPNLIFFNCLAVLDYKMLPWCNSLSKNSSVQMIHSTSVMSYIGIKHIPLPENIEDIDASEKSQFCPHRSRDISGLVILSKTMGTFINNQFATGVNCCIQPSDPRLHIYDSRGPVSLHSSMQTNVPDPFSPKGKAMYLNMPGGQWGQGHKYISDDVQNFHFWNSAHQYTTGTYFSSQKFHFLSTRQGLTHLQNIVHFCSSVDKTNPLKQLSPKQRLKILVKDYGPTVIVFHVAISLLSLGGCYLVVASGVSLESLESILKTSDLGSAVQKGGTFVVAYAIHKLFAPVRLGITAVSVPFIVRYLRGLGILKPP